MRCWSIMHIFCLLLLWEAEFCMSLLLARVSKSVNHSAERSPTAKFAEAFRKPHFDSTCRRRKATKIGRTFHDIRY